MYAIMPLFLHGVKLQYIHKSDSPIFQNNHFRYLNKKHLKRQVYF